MTRIVVDVQGRPGGRSLATANVSRHGIFLATPEPPPERHVVQLTLHTPLGRVRATAWVSRSVRPPAPPRQRGAGVQFFSLGAEDKQRWDDFFFQLGQEEAVRFDAGGHDVAASFVVKLRDKAALRELDKTCVEAAALFLVTPVLKPVGMGVALHLVHPETEEEFVLLGEIARMHTGRPKGLEIRLTRVSRKLRQQLARFIDTGEGALDDVSVRRPEPTVERSLALVSDPNEFEDDEGFDIDVFDEESLSEEARFHWDEAEDSLTIDLDLDEDVGADFEMSGLIPAPVPEVEDGDPSEESGAFLAPPRSAEELVERLGPARRLKVRCDHCDLAERIELGPCAGLLGLVADDVPMWDPEARALCIAPRLAPVKERRARLTQASGPDVDPLKLDVPLSLIFEVAALHQAPTTRRGAQLQSTRAVRELERAAGRLTESVEERIAVKPCPRCDEGTWAVALDE